MTARLAALFLAGAALAQAAGKWAFVAGIDDYANLAPLDYAVSDAKKIARALSESGFKVTESTNRRLDLLQQGWQTFLAQVQKGDIAVVYFAGHGLQENGVNYLLARDYGDGPNKDKAVSAGQWILDLNQRQPALKVVFLDACRTEAANGKPAGLAPMENPEFGQGTYIVFATSPGRVAKDQLFATALAREILRPGQLLPQVFSATAAAVERDSVGAQSPFAISSGAIPEFYFSNPDRSVPFKQAEEGQCDRAMPTLLTLSRLEPNDGLIWMKLAECQARAGDLPNARRSLDRARSLIDRPHQVDTELARIALADGDTFEAKERLRDALLDQPDFAGALVLRGRILMQEGKFREAVDVFEGVYSRTGSAESCRLFAEALDKDGAIGPARVQAARCAP